MGRGGGYPGPSWQRQGRIWRRPLHCARNRTAGERSLRPWAPCGRSERLMAEGTRRRQLRTFPGLLAEDFQHPDDLIATSALQAIPGLDTLVAKVLEYGFERV